MRGQIVHADAGTTNIPDNVKAIFVAPDDNTSDDITSAVRRRYLQGDLMIFLHKPSNLGAAAFLMYLFSADDGNSRVSRSGEAGTGDGLSVDYDLIGVASQRRMLHIPDIYDENKAATSTTQNVETCSDDEQVSNEQVTNNTTRQEPTAYEYGRFAEEVIDWMLDMTKSESRASRGDVSAPDMICNDTQVINAVITDYQIQVNLAIKVRMWVGMMYNFDADEDFYNVITELEMPNVWGLVVRNESIVGYNAFSLTDMNLRCRWSDSEYAVRDQWNVLPVGAGPQTTITEVHGLTTGSDISLGLSGLEAAFTGHYESSKSVETHVEDVELSTRVNVDGNWMAWDYAFGARPKFSGRLGKIGTISIGNSAAGGNFTVRQSWDWVVSSTQRRGDVPFVLPYKFYGTSRTVMAYTDILCTMQKVYTEPIEERTINLTLPVPERFRHVYSFTTNNISDLSEYNNLIQAMMSIDTNARSFYNKLVRLDENGNPIGRTDVTEEHLEQKVGREWYQFAKCLSGKRIAVDNIYRFYVVDERGYSLPMYDDNGNRCGRFLVVSPDGISID